jgi:hypothetical protein
MPMLGRMHIEDQLDKWRQLNSAGACATKTHSLTGTTAKFNFNTDSDGLQIQKFPYLNFAPLYFLRTWSKYAQQTLLTLHQNNNGTGPDLTKVLLVHCMMK